jgi:hypothetical protein
VETDKERSERHAREREDSHDRAEVRRLEARKLADKRRIEESERYERELKERRDAEDQARRERKARGDG